MEAHIITREQLEEALRLQEEADGFLGQILLQKGWINDQQLCSAISEALHINCVSIDSILIGEDILNLIPGSLAISCKILPIFTHDDTLYLAMENPRDGGAIQMVEYTTGMRVKPLMAPPCQLQTMIRRYYEGGADASDTVADVPASVTSPDGDQRPAFRTTHTQRLQRKLLGEYLVEHGLITQDQLKTALSLQKGKRGFLGQILIEAGWVNEEDICQALSDMLHVKSVHLTRDMIDVSVSRLISESLADSCNVLPLFIEEGRLYLAMENPLDIGVIQLIEFSTRMRVEPLVALPSQLHRMIKHCYSITAQ